MLNWSLETIITLLSGIPMVIGVILLRRRYLQHRDRIFLLLTLSWSLHLIYLESFGLAYLLLESWILRYNSILLVVNMFLLTLLFDFMNGQSLDPIKSALVSAISVFILYSAFLPDSVEQLVWANGDLSFTTQGIYRLAIVMGASYLSVIYIYYAIKIIWQVPDQLRQWAWINLIGVFIFGQIVTLFFLFGLTNVIPGIATLISALGGTLSMYAFIQSPQLIYVLPFKTYQLLVIDANSGTTLYSHKWSRSSDSGPQFSADLISSALSGLNAFATEAIQMGQIKELILENAELYIKPFPVHDLQFVLIASSISPILVDNVDQFASLFISNYVPIGSTGSYTDTTSFGHADNLIEEAFPYIPIREK